MYLETQCGDLVMSERFTKDPMNGRSARRRDDQWTREYTRRAAAKRRQKALFVIARRWDDEEPRCRVDTLPEGHPLKKHDCWGALEIDHLNGGGARERRAGKDSGPAIVRAITNGTRKVDDLRILCRLHQLWNFERQPGSPRKDSQPSNTPVASNQVKL